MHERCAAAGVGFVDAPVSGGKVKAESGELAVMLGGTDADVAAVEPLLEPFARQVFHVGPPGAGTVAKLVNNQLFLAASVLVQEAYVLGAAAGLEPSGTSTESCAPAPPAPTRRWRRCCSGATSTT